MKIGIFLPQFELESGGGYTFPNTILEELYYQQSNHDIFVFYYGHNRPDIGRVKFVPLSFFGGSFIKKAFLFIRRTINRSYTIKGPLYRSVKKYGIDIVWFITPTYEYVDVPFIFTVWDLQHRLQPFFPEVSSVGWNWEARERHYNSILPRATFVLTGTQAGKNELIRFFGITDERIRLLLHPTPDFALRSDADIAKSKLELPGKYIFYPAQFWSHKNHITLLRALKIVNQKWDLDLHLVLSGSDKGNQDYIKKAAAQIGIADKVIFLGFVEQDDLVVLYKKALALTYITLFGPENLPPLEAFALGCPVIASKVSGAEEQLGTNALLVNPLDEMEIAKTIKKLHDDPELRKKLIASGKARAKNWTSEDYVKGMFKIIDEFELFRRCWE